MKVCIKDGHFPFSWHNTVTYRTQLNTRITVYVKTCSKLNVLFSLFLFWVLFLLLLIFFSNTIIFSGLHKNGGSGVKPLRKLDTANITYHCIFTTSLVFIWLTGYIQSLIRVSKIISVCTVRMLQV